MVDVVSSVLHSVLPTTGKFEGSAIAASHIKEELLKGLTKRQTFLLPLFLQVVAVLLEGFIDEGEAKCVSKAQRYPIYNILRSEHNYRKKISQVNPVETSVDVHCSPTGSLLASCPSLFRRM